MFFFIVRLHVNEMLILGSNIEFINTSKSMLNENFDMKELDPTDVVLGMKIRETSDEYRLSQFHFVKTVLKKFNHGEAKPASTPCDLTCNLIKNKGDNVLSTFEYFLRN